MEQLGFEGMPRRLYACTPTRLSAWLDCPRRYRMSYLDRPPPPKGPPWAHNSLGASVHNALAGWWRLPLARRTAAAAGYLVDRGWIDEGFADETQSVRQRERAIAMVEGYVAGLDPADEPLGVERTVATRTDKIAVSGRIDRLDARPALLAPSLPGGPIPPDSPWGRTTPPNPPGGETELVVVDYKTGRRELTTDDARSSMALALYALAAGRALRRPCHRVELHHLPTCDVLGWSHTDEALARHLGRAEDIAEECAAADERMRGGLSDDRCDEVFPPRPGPACAWCDYRRHCPEGQAAAAARRPWDGLPADLAVADITAASRIPSAPSASLG
jgi:RecB family exonuclease